MLGLKLALDRAGARVYAGVPDSCLSTLISDLDDDKEIIHVRAPSEAVAVAVSAGHAIASGGLAVAYMQNSGLGNAVNPLSSLCNPEMFAVPLLLVIGWRGQPGTADVVEHDLMGRITPRLLDLLGIETLLLDGRQACTASVLRAAARALEGQRPVAILVPNRTTHAAPATRPACVPDLDRKAAIDIIVDQLPRTALYVGGTGYIARQLAEIRAAENRSLYIVGSMGCASAIGYGVSMSTENTVVVLDGDGAALMHMGAMAMTGSAGPRNLVHVVLDNGSYESTGGQSALSRQVDLCRVAADCGYRTVVCADTAADLVARCAALGESPRPAFVHVRIAPGSGTPARVAVTPTQNKARFQAYLRQSFACAPDVR